MRSARRHRALRFVAFLLVVWLAADALSHGTCAHDLIAFASSARSQVGDTSSHQRSTDRDDVNHCACHWQYLPAPSPWPVELHALAPIVLPPTEACPPIIERPLDRPPQRRSA
jgi:hypothetical protein